MAAGVEPTYETKTGEHICIECRSREQYCEPQERAPTSAKHDNKHTYLSLYQNRRQVERREAMCREEKGLVLRRRRGAHHKPRDMERVGMERVGGLS